MYMLTRNVGENEHVSYRASSVSAFAECALYSAHREEHLSGLAELLAADADAY